MATGMLADFTKNNPFAGLSQQTYTAQTPGVDAQTETVEGRVNNLISSDNALMQKARSTAQMQAGARGLLNSSLSAGAGTSAMLDAATPIAAADARTYSDRAMFNATESNEANKLNADWNNQLMAKGVDIASQWGLNESNQQFQTGERLGTQQFTAGQSALDRAQQTALQSSQQKFQAGQNQLDRAQQTSLQTAAQQFQSSQAEQDRAQQIMLADKNITAQQALQTAQQEFQSSQAELDRSQQSAILQSQQQFTALQSQLDRDQQQALIRLQDSLSQNNVSNSYAANVSMNTLNAIQAIQGDPNLDPDAKKGAIQNAIDAANASMQWGSTFYNTTLPGLATPGQAAGALTPGAGAGAGDPETQQRYENLVKDAYAGIGRTGFGNDASQIDQSGYDYWVNQLKTGRISEGDFAQVFQNAATQS